MKRTLSRTMVYPHPIERVWAALTDRTALGQWLMPNDFEPVVGHEFRFRAEPAPGWDGVVHCRVLELDRPTLMRISWRGGPIDTVVSFRLTGQGEASTRLEFEQSGFDGPRALLVSFILGRGWPRILDQLLPGILDRLARGPLDPAAPSPPEPTRQKRVSHLLARVVARLPGRRS